MTTLLRIWMDCTISPSCKKCPWRTTVSLPFSFDQFQCGNTLMFYNTVRDVVIFFDRNIQKYPNSLTFNSWLPAQSWPALISVATLSPRLPTFNLSWLSYCPQSLTSWSDWTNSRAHSKFPLVTYLGSAYPPQTITILGGKWKNWH